MKKVSLIYAVLILGTMICVLSYKKISIETKEENAKFAIYIENQITNTIPSKEENYILDEEKSNCTNNLNITWDNVTWGPVIEFTNFESSKVRTKCNLYFKKNIVEKGQQFNFESTGDAQEFYALSDGNYKVELWGSGSINATPAAGTGAYTSGEIYLKKGDQLYVYVGNNEGYNGGGVTDATPFDKGYFYGGGATDIRLKNGSWDLKEGLSSRIMVAAGGGKNSHGGDGGPGGELIGLDGIPSTHPTYTGENSVGHGGTQISGGLAGYHNYSSLPPENGTFGRGGSGENDYGGSGGGGYYGGGGGGINPLGKSAGGGGSSFISGHPGCIAIISETNQNPKVNAYTKIEDSYHYSKKIFKNTTMLAGNKNMLNPRTNETMVGNVNNGYARITYIGL